MFMKNGFKIFCYGIAVLSMLAILIAISAIDSTRPGAFNSPILMGSGIALVISMLIIVMSADGDRS